MSDFYKPFFHKLHECDCSICPKAESCEKKKQKEAEMQEMDQSFCDEKTKKAGDGTKYTYKNGSCEITKCPTGSILDKGTSRCHKMAKD